jgi:cellulose synthase/poly-beta-1,6-N-acetylglucosamine synthase-like glycosyltransferase
MKSVNGFSSSNVTEDLELAVNIQLNRKIRPKYLDVVSSEQTPPSIVGFFRQRLRWGSGGCQVIGKLHNMSKEVTDKNELFRINSLKYKLFLYSPVEWIAYFSISFYVFITYLGRLSLAVNTFLKLFTFPPIYIWDILLTTAANLMTGSSKLITFSAILCGIFVLALYIKYSPYIENAWTTKNLFKLSLVFLYVIFIIPYVVWIYSLPFISSFVLYTLGIKEKSWVRTERTVEV